MKAKENTGVFEEHFTLGTSLSGKEQLSKKNLEQEAKQVLGFGWGLCWVFCWIFFHCLVAQLLLAPQSSSLVLLQHATLAIPARLLLPKCCTWCTSTTKESSTTATCIWTGIIHFLKSDLCSVLSLQLLGWKTVFYKS